MPWVGPYKLRDLIENCMEEDQEWPHATKGAYLVSVKSWEGEPGESASALYVGSSGENSNRFCTRIGDLVADMLGFYDGNTGHHSGGQKIWEWCRKQETNPLDLYMAWKTHVQCVRCEENYYYDKFDGDSANTTLLNAIRPAACPGC